MAHDRHIALHVVSGPFHGPWLNAVCAVRRDMPHLSHLVADVSPSRPEGWGDAALELSGLADGYSAAPTGAPCRHGVDTGRVAFALLHGVSAEEFLRSFGLDDPVGFPVLEWDYGSMGPPSPGVRRVSCGAVPTGRRVWPMLDVSRLMCVEGRPSVPTVSVVRSPVDDPSMREAAHAVFHSDLPPDTRVAWVAGDEACGCHPCVPWRFGAEWAAGALSGVVVAPLHSGYPLVLASCMAMGRACVALSFPFPFPPGGDMSFGGLVRDGETCLVASTPAEAAGMCLSLLSDPARRRSLGTAAIYAAMPHDRDPNMLALREELQP